MKQLILFFFLCIIAISSNAQQKHTALFDLVNESSKAGMPFSRQNFIENIAPFSLLNKNAAASEADAVRFSLNKIFTGKIFQDKPVAIILSIPFTKRKIIAAV